MEGKCRAGALVSEIFKKEGVQYLFGIPGGHIYPTMERCEELGIKFIGVRHEMTAAFAAGGWALTTGKLGVCTGTAGPGVTNLLTGLANSYVGGFPVFALGGKARVTESDRNELQDFNQMAILSQMTKHSRAVAEVKRIPEYVGRAVAQATTGRPGPVYIEIPRDLMESEVELSAVAFQENYCVAGKPQGDPASIQAALDLIKQAYKPVIIAGSGVWFSQAHQELREFVEKTGIPFATRNAARGCITDKHPLFISPGYDHPILQALMAEADLAIVIGTRPGFTLGRGIFRKDLKIIRIDIDAAELTNQLDITVGIHGDAREVLKQLNGGVDQGSHPQWAGFLNAVKQQFAGLFGQMCDPAHTPIHPVHLMNQIAQRVDEETVVVIDGGDTATWATLVLPAYGPGQMLSIAGTSFGPLGVGMGYAIAAKLAHPEKKVIMVTGDGAFGYGAAEFDTLKRYGLDITTIILNDGLWGMIKRSEAKKASGKARFVGVELMEEVRYEKMVESLGGYGEFVTDPAEVGEAIDRALASGTMSCVNVITDPQFGPPSR
ncbi:thiamine pyrophosphate-binding protein [Desulfitobacterium chlororespirans]|uniref:Acetolactate synthase-1/2/3 large subunit n=1 Tax=Desulfitobacterium chlororespirans DSM 11544 TaxID=1121395 RepID=A0A1M7UW33_9FIRM|nr:thiamine pyrophosphate-binding protein [Desulfitobacterium chlororespirans]SHN87106.1 acetolactate synthase-1/2/3 large subunit [Desulfitobacterium chlororespirans DSM 11544]